MMSIPRLASFAPILAAALALPLALASPARAIYYVGHDIAEGTNNGHLTLLVGDDDHFHRLGVFGGAEGQIPEAYVGGSLRLMPGAGALAGRYVSAPYNVADDATSRYSDLTIRSISSLLGFPAGSPEAILASSSGGRYLGPLAGVSLALELVSISEGLQVGDALGNRFMANVGDRYNLGPADSFAPFTPTFFTGVGAASGTYSATFRLVDLNGVAGQSGTFRYNFQTVPEPASLAMAGLGLGTVGLVAARRRRKSAPAPMA